MKSRLPLFLLVLAAVVWAAGCSSKNGKAPESGGLKPESAHNEPGAPASSEAGLKFTPPAGWIAEKPSSSSRQAQYKLPRAAQDSEDAEAVAYYFGGGGGSTQANVDRWIGQFTGPDGKSAPGSAQVTHKNVGGIPLTIVDVSGAYSNSMGSMQQGAQPQQGVRMLGAIAETDSGPWFIKLTGPERTVAKWKPSFEQFLDSLHK
jgi:hypothetical protein